MPTAYYIKVSGIVQGVGFRPFVYRLARAHELTGWVLNAEEGVEIHLEGEEAPIQSFLLEMKTRPPQAATIAGVETETVMSVGFTEFTIRDSTTQRCPTVRISPDLPVCENCLKELFDPHNRRYLYPYINCTDCGPRYSVIQRLPYDRPNTTMSAWPLDEFCATEYENPGDRRFHAQPVACSDCGPHYFIQAGDEVLHGDQESVAKAADYLRTGKIVAVKGLGGYHLACDAKNEQSVRTLRTRKFRKERPFAVMVKDLQTASELVHVTPEVATLMKSPAGPIVLARARLRLHEIAPDNDEIGVMLPYTPLHHLLFAAGAPEILVMTSANRSAEPIAYRDDDALQQLSAIADAFLIGERPIARRIDDSVARVGAFGPTILRRARGLSPSPVGSIPSDRPILALGADLKNSITLVVDSQAFVSQHIGDLDHYESFCAFRETIQDLLSMYQIDSKDLVVVRDAHPQYLSTIYGGELASAEKISVQHHRAHVASVLAERNAWNMRVIGISFDGTGYGDDGAIWGGEIFVGSVRDGFERVAHLRPATLPGGDAAAASPVQAAAGFLTQLEGLPDLTANPFGFPSRYRDASRLVQTNLRSFATTSVGRLFDTVAALLGFTREITFEGQAATWIEHLAGQAATSDAYRFPFVDNQLDFRPLLQGVVSDRLDGRNESEIARAFQRGVAKGLHDAISSLCQVHGIDTIVLSGGVFQNEMLLADLKGLIEPEGLNIWTNYDVPANDGSISLGQAAMAAFAQCRQTVPRFEELGHAWMAHVT
jgi:hydrogenase maturation protein HypF